MSLRSAKLANLSSGLRPKMGLPVRPKLWVSVGGLSERLSQKVKWPNDVRILRDFAFAKTQLRRGLYETASFRRVEPNRPVRHWPSRSDDAQSDRFTTSSPNRLTLKSLSGRLHIGWIDDIRRDIIQSAASGHVGRVDVHRGATQVPRRLINNDE